MTITRHNPDTGRFETVIVCHSCQILSINGVVCHEIGCPDAWRDEIRECKWCGNKFKPKSRNQRCCEDSCAESYYS